MDKHKYFSTERLNSGFAKRLGAELTGPEDVKGLAEYLGCSPQAVSLFRSGTAFPKTENLIKIAEYFNCSLDYLVGLSDEKTIDASNKAAQRYTGLSESAVTALYRYSIEGAQEHIPYSEMISELLSDDGFYQIIRNLIRAKRSQALADEARNRDPEYYEKAQQIHGAIQDAIALSDKSLVRGDETAGRRNTHEEDTEVYLYRAAKGYTKMVESLVKEGA